LPSRVQLKRVGDELAVDDVGDPPLECTQRFFLGLRLSEFAVEVRAARAVRVADLSDRDHADGFGMIVWLA